MIVVIVAGGGNPKAFVNSTSCSVLVLALLEPEQDPMNAVVKIRRMLDAIFITLQNVKVLSHLPGGEASTAG